MYKYHAIATLLFLLVISGCSINHPIAKDYDQYLINNNGQSNLPSTDLNADYSLSNPTIDHRYEFRAFTVGYAHRWIVEFGKILEDTLNSDDVQAAFGRLSEKDGDGGGNLIVFDLENYEFKSHMAHIALRISLFEGGAEKLTKTYEAQGISQGGKMAWGGPFAMKNATQQSTKKALDEILTSFIDDINRLGSAEQKEL